MSRDGSAFRRLTSDSAHELHPSWSPDGRQIEFQLGQHGSYEHPYRIAVVDADGRQTRRLGNEVYGQFPSWSPDGKRIAFTSYVEFGALNSWGIGGLRLIDADGTHLVQITNGSDYAPAWRPR